MSGPVGLFYRQFSITMATSIIFSGVVALTLIPALCAMILKNNHSQKLKRTSPLQRFLNGINEKFNFAADKYTSFLGKIIKSRVLIMGTLVDFILGIGMINKSVPSGFIPNEDQGMFYAIVQTPPGSTLERTNEITERLQKIAEKVEGIKSVSALAGYEILTEGTGANSGTCLINLENWEDRKHNVQEIIHELEEKSKDITGANIEFFQPPAVPGYGAAGGFELRLLDKTGIGDYKNMEKVNTEFVKELKKQP